MKFPLPFLGIILLAARAAAQCSGQISIASQSDADALSDCDTVNGDLTISNDATGTINLSDLEEVHGSLTVEGTSNLNSLQANDLESISGPVTIKDNANLNEVGLSGLSNVGGDLRVQGNDNLKNFPLDDLENVNGGMTLDGPFDKLSFSNLNQVNGQTSIQSSGTFSCGSLLSSGDDDDDGGSSVFSGSSYSCTTGTATTSTATSTGTSTDSPQTSTNTASDSDSGLSGGAIAGIVIAVVVVVILILLFLWLLMRRRRKQAAPVPPPTTNKDEEKNMMAVPPSGPNGKSPGHGEIPADKNVARKPLSAPQSLQNRLSGTTSTSPPVPAALMAGDRSSMLPHSTDDASLFLYPIPRQRPSEADVPMLDSGHVHEVAAEPDRPNPVYELDAGAVSSHQQPINPK
ncbi:hypothetical protein BDV59DRAFT_166314 [Aspergillus ambiguus]|uniref:putative GPI-anchored cell wall protein Pst1 n=1 Tax=Aspergillus ambiguus TaxID=176160 RepID=UPI003CCDC4A9